MLHTRLHRHFIPVNLHAGLSRYLLDGIRPGGYLTAVITNNLRQSVHLAAEPVTPEHTAAIIRFLEMNAPGPSWGSVEKMEKWLEPDPYRPPMPYDGCPIDHGGD